MPEAEQQAAASAGSIRAARFGSDVDSNLRSRTARGTIVNAAFLVGTNALGLVRAVAVAGILTTSQFGVWGLMMAVFMTVILLGSVGIGDKYVQQDDPDQTRAFEVAFTIQCVLGAVLFVAMLIGMPVFALLYDAPAMIAPGLALALGVPAMVLQLPLRVHYRRLDFLRQRTLQAIDPVLTLIVTVLLALAGLGVWALVIGALVGTWSASLAIVWTSPYRLRWRWDRLAAREYLKFSGPLFVGVVCTALLIQVPVTVSSRTLGVTAIAGIALASQIAMFTNRVDNVVTTTLYPAICAVKDRTDLLCCGPRRSAAPRPCSPATSSIS
jgi:PST family polysaccharide transporter